ncbi:hypothetical protein BX600DRAFT_509227 [Xylariales sp. PMI_506]|nr:hypothetical protein BX600DRAFT_509227 [Xylariales sp. PMI_506]
MSSLANQQTPAPNASSAASTPSYASAAGAQKKPSSTPLVATGSSAPVVATGSSQHAKSNSVSPVNGRNPIMPAVPTVVSSNLNGASDNHSRKPSVTMSASGPNSYSATANGGASGPKIQFGFQPSPAVSHSTPQGASAPIAIPGSGSSVRVPSPQHSPSPIPQPSVSGGRPSSGAQQGNTVTFGSFSGESHMRRPSGSHVPNFGPNAHIRNESSQSMVSDPSNQGPPPQGGPPGRGGFQPQGGRGRGGYNPNYNNQHQQMGYPPNGNAGQFRGAHPNQGRGGMPPNFAPRPQSFGPGTPPLPRASPALAPAMPHNPNGAPPYFYQPPNMGGPMPQVQPPIPPALYVSTSHKSAKKKFQRGRDMEKFSRVYRRSDDATHEASNTKSRRSSKQLDQRSCHESRRGQFLPERGDCIQVALPPDQPPSLPIYPSYPIGPLSGPLDLSPESGNFEQLLTRCKQYGPGYPNQFDMRGNMPMPGYPMYPMVHGQPHGSPAPTYQAPYSSPNQYPQGPQPMSRNPSQASEPRPTSSTGPGQNQTPQGAAQPIPAQVKPPAIAASPQFTRPKKSAAITIRNANGDVVDLASLKAPASPAPSAQSKTPPVVASTPTPPPKSSTPKISAPGHTRTDSAATKTQAEVQNEFKEKIAKQIAEDAKAKEEEESKAAAAAKAQEEKPAEPVKPKQVEAKPKEAEVKPKEEEVKPKEEEAAPAEAKAEDEEDEMERIIREMEEEDARREAEQEKISQQKKAAAEVKKKAEEEAKKDSSANDAKMREMEREAERLEEEKERRRKENEGKEAVSVADLLAGKKESAAPSATETANKLANLTIDDKPVAPPKVSPGDKRGTKPAPLNLNTNVGVEPPQPSAALQSLKTAKLLRPEQLMGLAYPAGISGMASPNPALNAAVSRKGTSFKYDPNFLLQFQKVFIEQPSLEFSQQVKSLIGDGDGGRSASARTPANSTRSNSRTGAGFSIGNFTAPGGAQTRTLPPGTTSEQRFNLSQMGGKPAVGGISSFQRPGGAFPSGSMMSRTPSSSNMAPHSPRTGSTRRNQSKRDTFSAKAEAQAAKTMPLTAGMKIEALSTSSTGWKPLSISQKAPVAQAAASTLLDPPTVQRKVKAALNKMTPENFDKISDQILVIASQSKEESDGRTLRQVIQLTFEKATDEAHWASMYAKFCKRMLENMSAEIRDENIKDKSGAVVSGGALFRKYLLNRCQEEFERGWKLKLPELKEGGDPKEAALMSDEYYAAAAAKRRGLGLVQFIGELYKLQMLTERIMHECVRKLVDYSGIPDEAEVESLSKLLRTIGANLDASEKGKLMMDAYFSRIQSMVDLPDLPSRLKFMLMDVVDLRRANWASKEANKGPKTLEEVRAEAEAQAAQKAAEAARSTQRGPGGRPQMGRGDARQFSSGFPQPAPNQVGMDDLRRLKGSANRTSSQNISLGPTSMFSSRSNSGRRLGPGGSLTRGADDSAASSRTGTPPTQSSQNAFSLLANMEDGPTSPPSTAASPALSKVTPDTAAANKE